MSVKQKLQPFSITVQFFMIGSISIIIPRVESEPMKMLETQSAV